jgi:hypothetical protein
MNATFNFSSAQEITPDIIDVIRHAWQEKPVSIYIQEYDPFVPEWQIQEVRRRDAITENNPVCFLDGDKVMSELENELETV